MSDMSIRREAYLDWIAAEGPHQAHVSDAVDAYVAALEAEVERLQARVRELLADPRLALTADDLEWATTETARWAVDDRVTSAWVEGMVARSDRFHAALAAVSAKGNDDG